MRMSKSNLSELQLTTRISCLESELETTKRELSELYKVFCSFQNALTELYLNHNIERVALDPTRCDYMTHEFMLKITKIIENISTPKIEREVRQVLTLREILKVKKEK